MWVGPGGCFQSTQYGGIRFQVQVGSIMKDGNFCLAFSFSDLLSHFSETSCHVGSCPNSEAIWQDPEGDLLPKAREELKPSVQQAFKAKFCQQPHELKTQSFSS